MDRLFYKDNSELNTDLTKTPLFWGVLLFSMLLKYGYYGFTYFPTIDDHNMYGIFSMMSPVDALLKYKMYTTRPLAVVLDTYVISRLWGNLWVILLAVTLLHFISSYLVYRVFESNNLRTGIAAVVIFSLLPLANDASYWIAASSRIVVGLFFALLSFFLFMKYVHYSENQSYTSSFGGNRQARLYFIAFPLTNLISLGFYEQVIAFSFIGILILIVANLRKLKYKWVILTPFINIAALAAYYYAFRSSGNLASRGQLLRGDYVQHTINVYKRIKELMTSIPLSQLKQGVINGTNLMLKDRAFIFVILALIVSTAIGVLYSREKVSASLKTNAVKFIIGVFLVFMPYAPFFVLQVIWIVHRNTFISIIGVGLIIESLVATLFIKRDFRVLRGIAAGLAVFVFLLGNLAELNDYKSISNIDNEIAVNITEVLEKSKGADWNNYEVMVFNAKNIYINPTSRHFSNITGADWALTGGMSSILRKRSIKTLYPVLDGVAAKHSKDRLTKSILIGMNQHRDAFPLTAEWTTDTELLLKLEDGSIFGKVEMEEGGYITFSVNINQ